MSTRQKPVEPTPKTKFRRPRAEPSAAESLQSLFPIVGIGASAGGLEALEAFLKNVPKNCGLAFVVVQHLDPTHKGIMVELLQRGTEMPVAQITDRMRVEPNHVYVIPPNRDLSILHGVLHLHEPAAPRGRRLPIDFFFRSLADDRSQRSIGVILSGMGSDGTLGVRAIKEKGGAVFVQEPATAKFDSMPRSAIDSGVSDVIAPAEELVGKILAYLKHLPLIAADPDANLPENEQSGLEKVVLLLRTQTGHDFSHYKKSTIYRRIERRMGLHQLAKIADYVRFLRDNPQEAELLFKELLIGVTSFFRDPAVWEQLKSEVIPALLAAHPSGGILRAWIAGCATGEEAYSLAIVFREALERIKPDHPVSLQVFATDLDKEAIGKAREGRYPLNIAADVSDERLRQFFVEDERGYRVSKAIREMVIFAPQNLVMDPPFTKLDILVCRNLLIYLTPELQKKLVPLFHYSLNPGGILVLGSSETIGTETDRFDALPGKTRIYQWREVSPNASLVEFPTTFAHRPPGLGDKSAVTPLRSPPAENLQALADQLLLLRHAPPAVLVGELGDILYISGKTGKYLEPAVGKANWNLLAMARDGLSHALSEGFRRAVRKKTGVELKGIELGTNGGTQFIDVLIEPLEEPAALRGKVMVIFKDVAPPLAAKATDKPRRGASHPAQLATVEQELRRAYDELQTTREEMQSAQEELQSTNEEMQSTNEELTTSKEEMQSMNEELHSVNAELQAKLSELTQASDDMHNLLNSTEIATLFLDQKLHVRRFTTQTAKLFKLIPVDTGRSITDIVTTLDYTDLESDVQETLRTLAFSEKQVSATDGRWFRVRVMPYRTQDNRIVGVVITFTDISVSKKLEAELRAAQQALQERFTQQTVELEKSRSDNSTG